MNYVAPPRIRLVGVTLLGPQPIGRIHLPLEDGVAALYGRNGAGKSRILEALSAALRGEQSPEGLGIVHVSIRDPFDVSAEGGPDFEDELTMNARDHLDEQRGAVIASLARARDEQYLKDGDNAYGQVVERLGQFAEELADEEFAPYLLTELVNGHLRAQAALNEIPVAEFRDTLQRVAEGGHFALRATGSPEQPRWAAYAAMSTQHPDDQSLVAHDRAAGWRYREWTREILRLDDVNDRISFLSSHPFVETAFPWARFADIANTMIRGAGDFKSDLARLPTPDWVTYPVVEIGTVTSPVARVLLDASIISDVDDATRSAVVAAAARSGGHVMALYEEGEAALNPEVETYLAQLVATANDIVADILPDNPRLRFTLGDPHDWLKGRLPLWAAEIREGLHLPLEQLSGAQARWAALACALAINRTTETDTRIVFLCDEPESGLHRLAEQRLPNALARLATVGSATVVVATHSPAMLNTPGVRAHHVSRLPSGEVLARPLSVDLRDGLTRELEALDLGLTTADLLQLVRVVVVVEGAHDEAALKELLGDQLDPSVVIYPVGGAKQIPSLVTAGLLWDFTEADVMVVLDGLAAERLEPIWQQARDCLDSGDAQAAQRALAPLVKIPGGEAKWLHELLARALVSGHADRLLLQTLSEPDIVCYLPAEAFVPGRTWKELKEQWRASCRGRTPTDLKQFLKEHHAARFSTARIRRAAASAPASAEIQGLGFRIQEAVAYNRASPGQQHP